MKPNVRGLLVSDRDDRLVTIETVLDLLSVETTRVRNCVEAEACLCDTPAPHLVVADTVLSDGNWLDLMDNAAKVKEKVTLIVVSPFADVNLYIEVMNHGAFDFITESFTVPEVTHVLRSAIDSALRARIGRKPSRRSSACLAPIG